MRLIDAEKLEELMCRQCNIERWDEPCEPDDCFLRNVILDMPTVDAVPVVHGRWLYNGVCEHKPARFRNPDKWTIYKCSECGYSNGRRKNANYCPNCGARMDLEVVET